MRVSGVGTGHRLRLAGRNRAVRFPVTIGGLPPFLRHAARRLPPRRRRLVREALRRADRAAGARLAGDPGRPAHADRGAHRLRQDARRVPRRASTTWCARRSAAGCPTRPQVVYVSPLKALSNDVEKNLEEPLAGIRAELAAHGPAGGRDPHPGAHRRHAGAARGGDGEAAAAHPGDDAGVALHPAHQRGRAEHAADRRAR